jgi:NAD(P)-dependent dehydrogenase (short-subunit alcohol dehydrogenase family)
MNARTRAAGRAVVITGTSSGLGRACALHLDQLGFQVFAGVRQQAHGEELLAASTGRMVPLLIDVTDEKSVRAAAETVAGEAGDGGLWGLVNNAGIVIPSPLEWLEPERLRQQLETNLIGQLCVIREFLPLLRRQKGRIVNVTSGLGSVGMPFLGAYVASQFAKEGLSDVLRRELAGQGIAVSVIRTGAIVTPMWEKAAAAANQAAAAAPPGTAELYRDGFLGFIASNERTAKASKTTPADFAKAVASALTATRPKIRYAVGRDAAAAGIVKLIPAALLDRQLSKVVT